MQIIDRVVKARKMRCSRHAANTGWVVIFSKKLTRRKHVESLVVDCRIILKWTLER
jgi:hypothetical protein